MSASPRPAALGTYLRALREVRAFWPHIGLVTVVGLLGTPIGLLLPMPVKLIVDSVLGGQKIPETLRAVVPDVLAAGDGLLFAAIAAGIGLALLQSGHNLVDWWLRDYVAENMVMEFRARLFRHALDLPHAGRDQGSRDAVNRIVGDAQAVQWTALYGALPLVTCGFTLVSMIAVTAAIEPLMALTAVTAGLPMMILIHFSQDRLRDKWHAVRTAESDALAVVPEALQAARVVSAFGQEDRHTGQFLGAARRALRLRLGVVRTEGLLGVVMCLSMALGTAAIIWIGVRDVRAGGMSVGELLMVLGYIAQIQGPLQTIGMHVAGQQRALVSAERIFTLLDEMPPVADRAGAAPMARAAGELDIDRVGFAYVGRRPVLDAVSLHIPAGARVGIVGRTGSGKSTLVGLIMRQIDPTGGAIRLDGTDLRDVRLEDLRRQFAVVGQDCVLFSGTIAENIAYGVPDAPRERIARAAQAARIHDFIQSLPDGYDTKVGECGALLSGGERQRIALARAFLRDSPILVLDEPTSAVDTETERAIVESLERLMQGRTTLMIAHRIDTLRTCDMVIRVERGAITVERAPTELVAA